MALLFGLMLAAAGRRVALPFLLKAPLRKTTRTLEAFGTRRILVTVPSHFDAVCATAVHQV